ncbi:MAG: dephospho-CoA kinase [Ruminococcaceae bacterium]|nr:dephospho-CoA kinase [Oscillospiraceae bacterium]
MAHIIGITGPSGSGKSLLCKYIEDAGIPCIDADEVYHSMLTPNSQIMNALQNAFGDGILLSDGSLNRVFLSNEVFNDPQKLELLNSTVLPIVIEKIEELISELAPTNSRVAVDAPTLIESGFHKKCDTVVAVVAPEEVRIARIQARDSISRERAAARIKAQKPSEFYTSAADVVLLNGSGIESFSKSAMALVEQLKEI